MNRVWIALALAVVGSSAAGCSPSAVGDPCTPEGEFVPTSAGAEPTTLRLDLNSVQCETRVCLSDYFRGRVSCPYGNTDQGSTPTSIAAGACLEVVGYRGYYTTTGNPVSSSDPNTKLCCPILGVDPPGTPNSSSTNNTITQPVEPQCENRTASDAVYCSCRCGAPSGNDPATGLPADTSQITLCACPSGFSCVDICDQTHGNCSTLPFGKWGSYCVKDASSAIDQTNVAGVGQCPANGSSLPIPQ